MRDFLESIGYVLLLPVIALGLCGWVILSYWRNPPRGR